MMGNFSLPAGESQPLKKARGRPKGSKNGQSKKVDKELMASLARKAQEETINTSGFHPTEFNVLILPDPAEDMITTKSGIQFHKPIDVVEKERMASQAGRIIEVSPLAFGYERWPDGSRPPQVGDKVIFAKYAGIRRQSKKDNAEYLMLKDKDIICTEDE